MLARGRHHSKHLQNSWNKYGKQLFRFQKLIICDPKDLLFYEQRALDKFRPDYNVCPTAGNTFGRRHSESTKKKISAKARGRKRAPRSKEWRDSLSKAQKGKPKPKWHIDALQAGRARRVYTEEQRKNISEHLKEQYRTGVRTGQKSQEYRNKISKTLSKLADHQVREIRRRSADGETGRSLSKKFNTPTSTISQIINMKRYRWVD